MAVTLSKYGSSINRLLCHLVGLSTDTKPIGTYTDKSGKVFLLENGSSFEEMDTDKKYLYDAENQQWNLASSGGGGGGSATLIEKSITENGEYNASDDSADGYSKVTVDVPNTYTAQDEGKVVDNGVLVAQTAYPTEITENDTYDTTNYNSITVNVSDGGGISAVAICTFDIVSGSFALEGDSGIIEDSAFESCSSLTSVTIPNSVTSIGESAFYECQALGTVTFESNSSLETIGESAFYKCHALSSITIPNSVTEIWEDVFADCEALETITFEPTTPPTLSGDLGVPTTCTIRVPQGTLSAYTSAENYPSPDDYTYEEY